jgi:hypothetical protein
MSLAKHYHYFFMEFGETKLCNMCIKFMVCETPVKMLKSLSYTFQVVELSKIATVLYNVNFPAIEM